MFNLWAGCAQKAQFPLPNLPWFSTIEKKTWFFQQLRICICVRQINWTSVRSGLQQRFSHHVVITHYLQRMSQSVKAAVVRHAHTRARVNHTRVKIKICHIYNQLWQPWECITCLTVFTKYSTIIIFHSLFPHFFSIEFLSDGDGVRFKI